MLPTRPQTNSSRTINTSTQGSTLADILERVLDKGIVIAGDISISIASTELVHIRIRLLISSVDKAKEMGINWWESDPYLSTKAQRLVEENQQLQHRLESLEAKLNSLTSSSVKEEIPLAADVKDDLYQTSAKIPSPVDTPIEVLDFQAQTSGGTPPYVNTSMEILDFPGSNQCRKFITCGFNRGNSRFSRLKPVQKVHHLWFQPWKFSIFRLKPVQKVHHL